VVFLGGGGWVRATYRNNTRVGGDDLLEEHVEEGGGAQDQLRGVLSQHREKHAKTHGLSPRHEEHGADVHGLAVHAAVVRACTVEGVCRGGGGNTMTLAPMHRERGGDNGARGGALLLQG
jgi:hypothetical protein